MTLDDESLRVVRAWEQAGLRRPSSVTALGRDPMVTHATKRGTRVLFCLGWDGASWRHVGRHDWDRVDLLCSPWSLPGVALEVRG